MPSRSSKRPSFREQYRQAFDRLHHPLTARDGIPEATLLAAEKKLGLRLPAALRDYYLIAGRERVLNHVFNRLWAPGDWELHKRKLIFMEENQRVVGWGVTASSRPAGDPAVFQAAAVRGALDNWYQEHRRCSVFLTVMLHWQAAFGGGMACTASAPAPPALAASLNGAWQFIGEVNKMRAFSRDGQAVSVLEWQSFGKEPALRVFAGASSKDGLDAIARDLKLQWD